MATLQIKRGSKAQVETAASANELLLGELYLLTDEGRLAIGTSVNTYESFIKQSDEDEKTFGFETGFNGSRPLVGYATEAGQITSVRGIKTTSGTITVAIDINGTPVTGLSSIAVTTSAQNVNATASNSYVVGDRIGITFSSNSSAENLEASLIRRG